MSEFQLPEINLQNNNLSSQTFKSQQKLALALKQQRNLAQAVDYYSQSVKFIPFKRLENLECFPVFFY